MDVLTTDKNRIFYRFNLNNFNAAENVGESAPNPRRNQSNECSGTRGGDTYIFGPTKLNTVDSSFIVMRTACSRSQDSGTAAADLVIGLAQGILSQRSRSGMSFSTISAGRLEAEPQVWSGISLRTGFR